MLGEFSGLMYQVVLGGFSGLMYQVVLGEFSGLMYPVVEEICAVVAWFKWHKNTI